MRNPSPWVDQCNRLTHRVSGVFSQVSFLEGSDVYFATALAFLRLHETEILQGEDIADVVSFREDCLVKLAL